MFGTMTTLRVAQQLNCLTSPGIVKRIIALAASQRGCMINVIDCMYSKLPSEND